MSDYDNSELAATTARAVVAANEKFSAEHPFVIVPNGFEVEDMSRYVAALDARQYSPRRVAKKLRFVDVNSFLVYVQKFRVGHQPILFHKASNEGLHLLCVFDYDEAGLEGKPVESDAVQNVGDEAPAPTPATGTTAKWGHNVAYLNLAYSRDYKTLRANADTWHKQESFALFIEENIHLFVDPTGGQMLELSQHLKGARDVQWESGKRLANGTTQFQYIEQIEARGVRGELKDVPETLTLRCAIHEGFSEQDLKVAFRWKLTPDKEIQFAYRLLTKLAERAAEDEVKKRVEGTTELPLLTVSSFNGITPQYLDE